MDNEIPIINTGTGGGKIFYHIAGSIIAVLGAANVYGGTVILKHMQNESAQQEIEEIIDAGDLKEARRLLQEYDWLPERYEARIEFKIQKVEALAPLENAIATGQYEKAADLVVSLDSMLDAKETIEIENRIFDVTPEGLFERIVTSNAPSELCRQYLEWHPDGEHRKRVIETYITQEITNLISGINTVKRFDTTYTNALRVALLLEEFQDETIELPSYLNNRALTDAVDAYLENAYTLSSEENPKVGMKVELIVPLLHPFESNQSSQSSYIALPEGEQGVIVKEDPGRVSIPITSDQSIVIKYTADKFSVIHKPTTTEKEQFREAIGAVTTLLGSYTQ